MPARSLSALVLLLAAASGGCCCFPGNCGPCGSDYGGGCCFCWPKPIVWCGECSECGPGHGQSCADCCGDCGILAWCRRGVTCGKGCGEIYWGEWVSDPPDCCDPCDRCYGCYTGQHGPCCLGPFQRLLAACHGYSYCPPPDCGPHCGGFCNRGSCGSACGCGGAGCASCGGGPHGAVLGGQYDVGYSEDVLPPPNVNLAPQQRTQARSMPLNATRMPSAPRYSAPVHVEPEHSIMEENWNIPKTQPVPGKPIHKAQQPPRAQMSYRAPAVGTGVRQANYQR